MNVFLTLELEQCIQEKVSSGLYYSASEVVTSPMTVWSGLTSFWIELRASCKRWHEIQG